MKPKFKKFRKRPVVVGAYHWMGDYDENVIAFTGPPGFDVCDGCRRPLAEHGKVKTLEGWHVVCVGDYIIRGVRGEIYPCKPDIFHMTYEQVADGTDG